jgi:hypothetical protein
MGAPTTIPHISSINPASGPVGSNVTINGTHFNDGGVFYGVFFNGVQATQIFTYTNTTIVARVPPGATTGGLQLFNATVDTGSNSVLFTVTGSAVPHITSLTPNNGGIGSSVVIAGTNFGASQGASSVQFHGTTATVASWSDTSITVTVPAMATTGNVLVTTAGGTSNGALYTITNPSNGGISAPIGELLIPVTNYTFPIVLHFDVTTFDDPSNGGFYGYKVEEIAAGRTPTCSRQIIQYRDLGVATVTATLSGYDQNAQTEINASETFTIGTVAATHQICTIVRGLTFTAQNLQYSLFRAPGAGPWSIIKVRLEGRVELTAYS